MKLYEFYADFGRMGEIESTFVATDEEFAALSNRYMYFGEVLGKHSEIYLDTDPSMFTVNEKATPEFCELLVEVVGKTVGGFDLFDVMEMTREMQGEEDEEDE